MSRLFFCLFLLLLQSCGHQGKSHRIGVDAEWYPIDFGPQQPYVNGFVEDLLLEMARYSGREFEKIDANWDSLLEGVQEKKYDAALSSLPPYAFNVAKYDFSQNFLDLGPVLIVSLASRYTELEQMKGEVIGLIAQDPAVSILQKYPDILMQYYQSIPDLLNAVIKGDIEGALLNQIPAANYIADLYAKELKIAGTPLTDAGLRLVAAKGKQEALIKAFDRSIEHFKKKNKLKMLLKKWNLSS